MISMRARAEPAIRSSVLVLDEHAHVRHLVGQFLRKHGYEAVEAASVKEAASVAQATTIQAVVLDFSEGAEPGLAHLTELRTEPHFATMPTVVITKGTLGEPDHALVTGLKAFPFHKPEGLAALIGFLDQLRTL